MAQRKDTMKTPTLEAFRNELPKTRIALIRLLWPAIRSCLDAGHSLRDIQAKLRDDGIDIAYSTLCWGVSALRESGRTSPIWKGSAHATSIREGTAAQGAGESGARSKVPSEFDPLDNIKRLTDHRPGFEYSGTLSDEELFGPK